MKQQISDNKGAKLGCRQGFGICKGLLGLMLTGVVGAMSGCSHLSALLPPSQQQASIADWKSLSGMDAPTMYQILLGEMLVQKGQYAAAYEQLYPIAEKTKNADLVKEVFQLSMYTYDEAKIRQATQLWLSLNPKEPTPWKAAFLMSVREGKFDQAWEQWERYQALTPAPLTQDLLSAAQRLSRAAPVDKGLPFAERFTEHYPQQWASWLGYGWIAADHGDIKKALPALKMALSKAQDAQAAEGEHMAAKVMLEVALKHLDVALEVLDKDLKPVLDKHPEWGDIQLQAAQLSVQLQRIGQAEGFFKTVIQKQPDNNTAHFGLGVIALQQRQWSVAREQFEWLAKNPPYQSVAFYYLGQLHQSLGEREKALTYYKKVKQGKFRVDAQIQQAFLQKQKESAEAIIKDLDAIPVKTKEEKAQIWRAKAQVWQQTGKVDEAIEAYQQAIKVEPNDVPTLYKLSALLYEAKRYQQYEETLKKILKLSPNEADALNALGYFYLEHGEDLSQSKPLLDRAYKLAPNRYYIIDSLGWWHHKAGDDSKAESLLRQALSLQLDDEVLAHLIELEMALGKLDEAQQLWQKLKKHFPKSDKLNEIVQKIGKK